MLAAALSIGLAPSAAHAAFGFEQVIIDATGISYQRQIGDLDGDGRNDVVAVKEGTLHWFPHPTFVREDLLILDQAIHTWWRFRADDMKLADIDKDGDLDVVARIGDTGDVNGEVVWFENPRPAEPVTGTWTKHTIGVNQYTKDIVVKDFDDDQKLDVMTREHTVTQIWFQDTVDTWTKKETSHPSHEGGDAGDLDGDGDPDVVLNGFWLETPDDPRTGTYLQHTIDAKWFTGQPGGWQANNCKVVVADIDGDEVMDVVLSHSELPGYPVSWYSAADPKNGPWTEHVVVAELDYCHNLQAADFNDDGAMDILAGGMPPYDDQGLTVFLGDGGSTWTPFPIQDLGSYSAEIGDLDNDWDVDIVTIRNHILAPTEIWRNTLYAPTSLDEWTYIEVDNARAKWGDFDDPSWLKYFGLGWGDVTGDDFADIVSGRYFYRNPGGDMTGAWARVDFGLNVDALVVVNVDDDAYGDVIAIHGATVYWLEADDALGSSWTAHTIDTTAPTGGHVNPQGYAVADVVQGGKPEVLVHNGDTLFYYTVPAANPEAGNWPRTEIVDQSNNEGIGIGDIDRDGYLDVAVSHYDGAPTGPRSIKWARNPGDGSANWTEYLVGTFPGDYPDRVAVADLNGDNRPDIIVSEEGQPATPDFSVYWFEAKPDPTEGGWTRRTLVTQHTTNSMDVADMDLDGDNDVILGEHRSGTDTEKVAIWENDGHGNFTEHVVDTGKESHLGARVADLDGDNDLEIMSIAWDEYQYLHLWRNDGGGQGPSNHPPIAEDDSFEVEPGSSYNGQLVATDMDPLDVLAYSIEADPEHGTITAFNSTTGAFTYEPDPGYKGPDSFTFKANDGEADSNTATISIMIHDINELPAADFTAIPDEGQAPLAVTFDATASYDPDGTITDYSWDFGDDSPAGSGVTTNHTYTDPGLYTATLTVEDNEGGTDDDTAQITVYLDANGLIAYWPFDENEGDTAADISGFGNDLTLHDGAAWADGQFGAALSLDGTDDYAARLDAELTGEFPAKSTDGAEDFSVAGWIWLDELNKRHPIVQKQGNEQRGFNFTVEPDNTLNIEVFKGHNSSTDGTWVSSTATLPAQTWVHVAVTYDFVDDNTSRIRLYIGGSNDGATDTAHGPVVGNTVDLNIGKYYWSSSYSKYFDGRIDEVRVYNRALTEPEIAALASPYPLPKVSAVTASSGGIELTWTTAHGATYIVQYWDGTPEGSYGSSPTWTDIPESQVTEADGNPGDEGTESWTDDGTSSAGPLPSRARYYRIKLLSE